MQMQTMRNVFGGLVLALLAACATPYQSKGYTGGFSETQLDVNVFRVNFNGTLIRRASVPSISRCCAAQN